MSQNIETTPVGHSHFNLFDAGGRTILEYAIEKDHQPLTSFKREALFPEEFLP